MKNEYDSGTLLSIPCSIYPGANLSEKLIECKINPVGKSVFTIEGAVSEDFTDIKKGRVIAAIMAKPSKDHVSVLFTGEIFNQGNPVKLPLGWVKEHCTIASVKRN